MRGKLLEILGALFLVSAFVVFVALQVYRGEHPEVPTWEVYALGFPIMLVLWIAGGSCFSTGKRVTVQSAQEESSDTRPPVLYLRSFKDDPIAAKGPDFVMPAGGIISGLLASFVGSLTTEEEQLAKAMNDIGPFTAIGKPGEKLPELGAERIYVSDSEWKDKVKDLMSRARLVVLRAGSTPGFWWEVKRAVRDLPPEKLVFLLPYDADQYEAFRRKAKAYLPCPLPAYAPGSERIGSIQAVLSFQDDWTPQLLHVKHSGQSVDWVREFKRSLEPVFSQLGVEWKKPASNLAHWGWLVLYLIIGVGALVLVFQVMGWILGH